MELLEEVSDDFVVNANDVFILFGKRNRFRVLSPYNDGKPFIPVGLPTSPQKP